MAGPYPGGPFNDFVSGVQSGWVNMENHIKAANELRLQDLAFKTADSVPSPEKEASGTGGGIGGYKSGTDRSDPGSSTGTATPDSSTTPDYDTAMKMPLPSASGLSPTTRYHSSITTAPQPAIGAALAPTDDALRRQYEAQPPSKGVEQPESFESYKSRWGDSRMQPLPPPEKMQPLPPPVQHSAIGSGSPFILAASSDLAAPIRPNEWADNRSSNDLFPRMAPDGNHYMPDPNRPGKYLMVV